MTEEPNDDDKLNAMINSGGDIAGGAVGAAIGFLLGGPAGAAVGGASGPAAAAAIRKIGHEATGRLLGPREKVRVGGALAIAAAHIEQRTQRGERVRTDGFFETDTMDEVTPKKSLRTFFYVVSVKLKNERFRLWPI